MNPSKKVPTTLASTSAPVFLSPASKTNPSVVGQQALVVSHIAQSAAPSSISPFTPRTLRGILRQDADTPSKPLSPRGEKRVELTSPEQVAKRARFANPSIALGDSPAQPSDVRVRHLTDIRNLPGLNLAKVELDHPFFDRIAEYKVEKDLTTGRNAAILIYKKCDEPQSERDYGYCIASTQGPPGAPHGETQVLDKLNRLNRSIRDVVAIFTERSPCPCCEKKLATLCPKAKIYYCSEYGEEVTERKVNEIYYQILQEEAGGVRMAKSTSQMLSRIFKSI